MAQVATPDEILEHEKKSTRWIAILERFGVLLFLFVLILFFTSQNERFLSVRNIFNILADVSIYGIMAVGMTFVILTAGVDLSVGSLLAFCSMCGAAAIKGTGESRYAPSNPHAFGGYGWLVALVICLVARYDCRLYSRQGEHKTPCTAIRSDSRWDDRLARWNSGGCRGIADQWVRSRLSLVG